MRPIWAGSTNIGDRRGRHLRKPPSCHPLGAQQGLLSFPVAKYDDQVDALALIGRMLAEIMLPGQTAGDGKENARSWLSLQLEMYARTADELSVHMLDEAQRRISVGKCCDAL